MIASRFMLALLSVSAVAADAAPAMPQARPASADVRDAALGRRLDTVVEGAVAQHRLVGTVVLVARGGRIVYARAAGLADREAGTPMRRDAIFRLASVSKPYVSAAAMRLAERGTIDLDRPVTDWLPGFRPALADGTRPVITLRQLMTHRSGLGYALAEPQGRGPYHALNVSDGMDQPGLSLAVNLSRLARAPLLAPPGTKWTYSLSIDVLGAVLAKATGRPLAQVVRENVTAPLGLVDTGFAVTDPARLAAPYADAQPAPVRIGENAVVPMGDGRARFAPSRAFDPASYQSGGAGMVGTADDLLRFLEAVRAGGALILTRASVATMMRDQVGAAATTQGPGWGFGYGWAVLDDPALARTPQSPGTIQWGGAYGHSWFVDPAQRLTVVALTNTTPEGMNGRFVTDLRDAVYGRPH